MRPTPKSVDTECKPTRPTCNSSIGEIAGNAPKVVQSACLYLPSVRWNFQHELDTLFKVPGLGSPVLICIGTRSGQPFATPALNTHFLVATADFGEASGEGRPDGI